VNRVLRCQAEVNAKVTGQTSAPNYCTLVRSNVSARKAGSSPAHVATERW
jgi:hypothetical protein